MRRFRGEIGVSRFGVRFEGRSGKRTGGKSLLGRVRSCHLLSFYDLKPEPLGPMPRSLGPLNPARKGCRQSPPKSAALRRGLAGSELVVCSCISKLWRFAPAWICHSVPVAPETGKMRPGVDPGQPGSLSPRVKGCSCAGGFGVILPPSHAFVASGQPESSILAPNDRRISIGFDYIFKLHW
jgi:hypothetical protein